MSEQVNSNPWFAVHIRIYKHENVETSLRHKGYEVFAPSYTAKRVVSGRERQFPAPLFPGYLFCALDPHDRLPVLTVPGVIGILGTTYTPTAIPAEEIEAIRRTVASGLPFEPFDLLQPGDPVQVQRGPLAGIKGVVVHHKGRCRLVIQVTALNDRAVSVEVDQSSVAPLILPTFPPARHPLAGSAQYYRAAAAS
jgi:transcription termination/antitermination protein NusG